jgi:large repetitive protein
MHTVFTNPPQISVSIPVNPSTSAAASFSVSATDNGTITNYYWSFGDGTFTNGASLTNVTHQYATTNSYDANVTVQDDSGEWERIGQWITVNSKSNQTINFPTISTRISTNTVALSATAGSGLPVSFAVYSGPGSISGSTNLIFTGAGQVSIVASQGGDIGWNAAPNVTNSFTVHGIPSAGMVTLQRATNQILKVTTTMLMENTTDSEGSAVSVVGVSPSSTNGGAITLSGRWVTYTPPEGNSTDDFFQFYVRNIFGGEAVGVAKVVTTSSSSTGAPTLNFSATPVAGNVELKIFGIPERTYIVQGATRLIDPDWINLRECTIGAGGYVYFTETNPPSPRFYRTAQP